MDDQTLKNTIICLIRLNGEISHDTLMSILPKDQRSEAGQILTTLLLTTILRGTEQINTYLDENYRQIWQYIGVKRPR
jgi:hypothetical protein